VALTLAGVVIVLQLMIFTYDGWTGALYFAGEIDKPGRDIPRAMVMGVVSVIVIYLLLNAAFLHLIPLRSMAGDTMVADTASRIVFGPAGTGFIRLLIAISLLSTMNSSLLMASRVLYAMGATNVNAGGTPTVGLAVSTIVSLAFLATGTFNRVIALAAFFFVANYTISFASVFWLRRKEPQTPRPYRAWGYPVTTGIVLIGSLVFLITSVLAEPRQSTYALALLALSYPVFRMLKHVVPSARAEDV
jgi:APA family basic amino acid/polyamine antiporter